MTEILEKLNNTIAECEASMDNEPDVNVKRWLKGMRDGMKLSIILMENEGLLPTATTESEAEDEDGRSVILKFPGA